MAGGRCWQRRRELLSPNEVSDKDREKAQGCLDCPLCKSARRKQRGLAFWFVRVVEESLCPQCKAYERVYGRKAHEPAPSERE